MSVDKKSFLLTKYNNFITWIEKDKVLPKNHQLLNLLKNYRDFDKLLSFINTICNYSDSEGNIPEESLSDFLSKFNVSLSSFKDTVKDKFTRYLKCFILAAKYE